MTLTNLQWVRRLIEDEVKSELESAVASGLETDFYVQHPPITAGSASVSLNGAATTAFTVVADRVVRLTAPPPAGTNVAIAYSHQTFSDDELQTYLDTANLRLDGAGGVYQAALYAIDSLLMGAATALDFGAGAESYNMTSVFQRLMQLRQFYSERVTEALDGEGVIVIREMVW